MERKVTVVKVNRPEVNQGSSNRDFIYFIDDQITSETSRTITTSRGCKFMKASGKSTHNLYGLISGCIFRELTSDEKNVIQDRYPEVIKELDAGCYQNYDLDVDALTKLIADYK